MEEKTPITYTPVKIIEKGKPNKYEVLCRENNKEFQRYVEEENIPKLAKEFIEKVQDSFEHGLVSKTLPGNYKGLFRTNRGNQRIRELNWLRYLKFEKEIIKYKKEKYKY